MSWGVLKTFLCLAVISWFISGLVFSVSICLPLKTMEMIMLVRNDIRGKYVFIVFSFISIVSLEFYVPCIYLHAW